MFPPLASCLFPRVRISISDWSVEFINQFASRWDSVHISNSNLDAVTVEARWLSAGVAGGLQLHAGVAMAFTPIAYDRLQRYNPFGRHANSQQQYHEGNGHNELFHRILEFLKQMFASDNPSAGGSGLESMAESIKRNRIYTFVYYDRRWVKWMEQMVLSTSVQVFRVQVLHGRVEFGLIPWTLTLDCKRISGIYIDIYKYL